MALCGNLLQRLARRLLRTGSAARRLASPACKTLRSIPPEDLFPMRYRSLRTLTVAVVGGLLINGCGSHDNPAAPEAALSPSPVASASLLGLSTTTVTALQRTTPLAKPITT